MGCVLPKVPLHASVDTFWMPLLGYSENPPSARRTWWMFPQSAVHRVCMWWPNAFSLPDTRQRHEVLVLCSRISPAGFLVLQKRLVRSSLARSTTNDRCVISRMCLSRLWELTAGDAKHVETSKRHKITDRSLIMIFEITLLVRSLDVRPSSQFSLALSDHMLDWDIRKWLHFNIYIYIFFKVILKVLISLYTPSH